MSYGREPCYIYGSTWHGKIKGFAFNRLNNSVELTAGMPSNVFVSDDELAQLVAALDERGTLIDFVESGKSLRNL